MSIDLKRYAALKDKGLMRMERHGPNSFVVSKRKFDPESTAELQAEILVCDQNGVRAQIAQCDQVIANRQAEIDGLTAQKAGLEQLLAEMEAAEAAAKKG